MTEQESTTTNPYDRREKIAAEWKALGLEGRIQSPAEMRRVLMTWNKAEIITALIRAESDAITANHKKLNAWAEAQEVRANRLILPREKQSHAIGYADPFSAWLTIHKGQTLDARTVFLEGWKAHAKATEALDGATPTAEMGL